MRKIIPIIPVPYDCTHMHTHNSYTSTSYHPDAGTPNAAAHAAARGCHGMPPPHDATARVYPTRYLLKALWILYLVL